ncbi:MAG: FCD domain-containing protein, partial [Oscillibacter sp.]|nr:FCD domain-containing protein [Oscillibacter sp.]
LKRIREGGKLPMITSCSPGWVTYLEKHHPELIGHLSTAKSPQAMFGAVAKTYYAQKMGWDPHDVVSVSVMPCTAKKYEASRPELGRDGYQDVDYVLTTRELMRREMIRWFGPYADRIQVAASGNLPYNQTQLAREMNVSQAPVREAILEMVALGMLEERPYSGHFVRALGPKEIEDIYQTRAVVEEYAAQRAADRATEDQLAEMKRLLQEMDAKRDLDRFVHQDMEFHNLVMDAAESAALKRAWSMLRMAEWTYIAAAITKSSLEEMIQQHWTIFRYLEARQAHSAGAYMYLHIKGFGEEVSQHFADQKKKEL